MIAFPFSSLRTLPGARRPRRPERRPRRLGKLRATRQRLAAPAAAPAGVAGLGGLGSHARAPRRGGLGGLASHAAAAGRRRPHPQARGRRAPRRPRARARAGAPEGQGPPQEVQVLAAPPFLAPTAPATRELRLRSAPRAPTPIALGTYGPGAPRPSTFPQNQNSQKHGFPAAAGFNEGGDDSGWGPKTFPRAPDTNIGEVLRVVSVPSVVVGLIVGGKGSNLDRLRRLYGNTQVRIADRDEPWQLGTNRRRRIAFTGAPEAIDACIEDVKQTLAGQSAKTGLPHTIEACAPPPKGWPTDALSGPLGHRELSASIPAPFLPGPAAAAAGGGLNPATGLPHTAAYLERRRGCHSTARRQRRGAAGHLRPRNGRRAGGAGPRRQPPAGPAFGGRLVRLARREQ